MVMRIFAAVWLLLWAGWSSAAPAPVHVRFPSLDRDTTGAHVMLDALWYRPADSDDKPVPVVIALHGCAGMYSSAQGRRHRLSLRLRAMAALLLGQGYAVLFPDSLRSRGREEICSEANEVRTLTQANRRLDALAAVAYVQSRPDVRRDRIALLGWSHGASTVLAAMDEDQPAVHAFLEERRGLPYVRDAIAFYPGCFETLRSARRYVPAAPMLLFVGAADDWTSPKPCIALVERLRAAGARAEIVVYPGTYHGFDGPDLQKPMKLDMPNGVHPGQGVTVAVNPQARADAYARVKASLHDAFAP